VAKDLQRKGYLGRTIGIKLRYTDFRTVTRDITLSFPTADPAAIRRAAEECLRRVSLNRKLRLLGVRASTLSSSNSISQDTGRPHQRELSLTASAVEQKPAASRSEPV